MKLLIGILIGAGIVITIGAYFFVRICRYIVKLVSKGETF